MTYINGTQYPDPVDPLCGRRPEEIPGYVEMALGEDLSPSAWVVREEGTYNSQNGHFLCDACYIKMGMPTGPYGWVCP